MKNFVSLALAIQIAYPSNILSANDSTRPTPNNNLKPHSDGSSERLPGNTSEQDLISRLAAEAAHNPDDPESAALIKALKKNLEHSSQDRPPTEEERDAFNQALAGDAKTSFYVEAIDEEDAQSQSGLSKQVLTAVWPARSKMKSFATMEDLQRARDVAVGQDTEKNRRDPYFEDGQYVELKLKGQEPKQFPPEFNPPGFIDGLITFDLETDVEVDWDEDSDEVSFTIRSVQGKPLHKGIEYYKRVSRIAGIQDILKNSQFILILLKNGDILTGLSAHSWRLFNIRMKAGAGTIRWAYIGGVPGQFIDPETLRIPESFGLEFYDARRATDYVYDESIHVNRYSAEQRYGDVHVVDTREANLSYSSVKEILSLASISDGMTTHIEWMLARFQITSSFRGLLSQEMVGKISDLLQIFSGKAQNEKEWTSIYSRTFRGKDGEETVAEWQFSDDYASGRAAGYTETPTEDRRIVSERLEDEKRYIDALSATANSPEKRATINWRQATENERRASIEGQMITHIEEFISQNEPRKKGEWVGKVGSIARYYGSRAAAVGIPLLAASTAVSLADGSFYPSEPFVQLGEWYQAVWSTAVSQIPESYAFSHWFGVGSETKVALFDLGFIKGPEVWYSAKWLGVGIFSTIVTFMLPLLVASHFGKKTLGEDADISTTYQRTLTGLQTIFTWAFRSVKWAMRSVRTSGARLVGKEDILQATRRGVLPEWYMTQGGETIGHAAVLSKISQISYLSSSWTTELMLRAISDQGYAGSDGKTLDTENLKTRLGEAGYQRFISKMQLLSFRIFNALETEIEDNSSPMNAVEIEKVQSKVARIVKPAEMLTSLIAPLSDEQVSELDRGFKKRDLLETWMRWAGGDNVSVETIVPRNVVQEGSPFSALIDIITQVWCLPLAFSFSDKSHPENLGVGDSSILGLGVVGPRFLAEFWIGVLHWLSHIPIDVHTWARQTAGKVSTALIKPEFQAGQSSISTYLAKTRPATLSEGAYRYYAGSYGIGTGSYNALNYFKAHQMIGRRVEGEFKNIKLWLYTDMVISFAIYGFGMSELFRSGIETANSDLDAVMATASLLFLAAWKAAVKVALSNAIAYPGYRLNWGRHGLGSRKMENDVENRNSRATDLLMRVNLYSVELKAAIAEEALPEVIALRRQALEKALLGIENFSIQSAQPLPDELSVQGLNFLGREGALLEQADQIYEEFLWNPRGPMGVNSYIKWARTFWVGTKTTVIGLTIFGAAWWIADYINPVGLVGIIVGLFAYGKFLQSEGRFVRTKFGYNDALRKVQTALKTADPQNEEGRAVLYEAVLVAHNIYHHFDSEIPLSTGFDINELSVDRLDLWHLLKRIYISMLNEPPMDLDEWGAFPAKREIREQKEQVFEIAETFPDPGMVYADRYQNVDYAKSEKDISCVAKFTKWWKKPQQGLTTGTF